MSYTPCPLCGEPLLGYAGSACSNAECGNRARPDDPNPLAKTVDGSPHYLTRNQQRPSERRRSALSRAFKGVA